jgi:hypothetical protein
MRLDQYSSRRNVRPGFPTPEEIKKTTQTWTGDALTKPEVPGTIAKEAAQAEKPPISDRAHSLQRDLSNFRHLCLPRSSST